MEIYNMSRIEICGNIASGKTTLCRGLFVKGCHSVLEAFVENPFYESFYKDPALFSFETEITFLLQHYHSVKVQKGSAFFVCDYSLLLDLAYADVNLEGNRHRIFCEIAAELQNEIGFPSRVIYLVCPEEILLHRIITRSREPETSITLDYLKALSRAISLRIEGIWSQIHVITIDSHAIDFRPGIDGIRELEWA
ncbi:MAG: deoxynucleoside kinase [Syntrophobacteraceae bacterium]